MIAFLQLIRLPNLFTVVADIMMGFLYVHGDLARWGEFLLLLLASASLYSAGMVLNDVFDVEQDRRERPTRPIPSGRVPLPAARILGSGLLIGGVAAAALAGGVIPPHTYRPLVVGLILAATIVAYDGPGKRTMFGPLLMGCCRGLNILLAMSTGLLPNSTGSVSQVSGTMADGSLQLVGYGLDQVCIAVGVGTYIAGITWFARSEAGTPRSADLYGGTLVAMLGLVLLTFFPFVGPFQNGSRSLTMVSNFIWPLMVMWIGWPILRQFLSAAQRAQPAAIQAAVKHGIFSLVILNAAICLASTSPYWWAVSIIALLLPMLFLGRWLYST